MKIRMSPQPILLFLIVTLLGLKLYAGGSVVGNGAGLVENRFHYAYVSLQKLLMNCLVNEECDLSAKEAATAEKVADVLVTNMSNAKKFVFLRSAEMEKVIKSPISEPHRIAMTGLSPLIPIYVNVDLLYSADGTPALDYSTIVGLIFHEVGHQAGEVSHAQLDIIASKLRVKLEAETMNYKFDLNGGDRIEITINNFSYPNKFAEIRMTRNKAMVSVGAYIANQFHCANPEDSVNGYEFFNGYFSPLFNSQNSTFNFITNLHCVGKDGQGLRIERKSVKFDISGENKVFNLEIRMIPE